MIQELRSSQNTTEVRREIENLLLDTLEEAGVSDAFDHDDKVSEVDVKDVFYEHGQWFARAGGTDKHGDEWQITYSVVDVEIHGETRLELEILEGETP